MELHASGVALSHTPVDDAYHLLTGAAARCQTYLAARFAGRLINNDFVTALGSNTGRFEATGTRSNHHDLALHLRTGDLVRHGELATRSGVVNAVRRAALIDAIETIIRADTGADVVLALLDDFAHNVRVGHVRPGHADHVDLTSGNGMPRRSDILNASRMKRRKARRRANFSGKIQVGRARHALNRDQIGQAGVGVNMTAHDVEEVHHPTRLEAPGNLEAVLLVEAPFQDFVRRVADADNELRSNAGTHGGQHVESETQPVFESTAVGRL